MDHLAALDGPQAGDGLAQLLLAAAGDAGHPQDFAPPEVEAHMVDGGGALVAFDGQVPDFQEGPGLLHHRPLDVQLHLPAHHVLGELLLAGGGGVHGTDVLPLPEDGHPVADLQHLVELVGDDDDGVARSLHAAEHIEEPGRLLHGEDGGGFVQDDDLGPVVQHLDDLQGLLL